MFATDDTIVAIATPPGRGGIGVVRVAGPAAVTIACTLTNRSGFEPRHATLTHVVECRGRDASVEGQTPCAAAVVDEVVVTWFQAPHSYTGDEVVEVSAHGSPAVMTRIVGLAVAAGARLAEPGEFTLRAYLAGRIDLVQAEAVADLVDAVTPLQARAAMDQLEGTLTSTIARIDAALFDLAARLEASLDFPDEGFHFVTRAAARQDVGDVLSSLDALAASGRSGRVVREGRLVAIVGPPNAGKSSLFNRLAGADRAIVAPTPGTTRDALTERVDVAGLAITLVDTAGLRSSCESIDRVSPIDPIEIEGMARARRSQQVAALSLVVIDRSAPLDDNARAVVAAVVAEGTRPALVVANKCDRPAAWTMHEIDAVTGGRLGNLVVSAATGEGIDALRTEIGRALSGRDDWRDMPAMSNLRHLTLVDEARAALVRADRAIGDEASEELVLTDIADARRALEAITGRRAPDDLLRHIFSTFCIGK